MAWQVKRIGSGIAVGLFVSHLFAFGQELPFGGASDQASSLPLAGYDSGFFVQSPDGMLRFTLEGLLQVRGTFFDRGIEGRPSSFDLERMRFEFGGKFYDSYLFHVEPKFTESDSELEEAWIGVDLSESGPRLILGRMKEPFSLEEMLPRKHIDFPTFSILNQFAPAEDHGVTLLGGSLDAPIEYGLAYYNGTGGEDLNSDKDVAARLVARPWAERGGAVLQRLQFGGAATFGREEGDLASVELLTEAKAPFVTFEPGSRADGERVRLGLEAAWLNGPLALSAEAIEVIVDLAGTGGKVQSTTSGWYAAASWVLTGEKKTFRGVKPEHPWIPGKERDSGLGALQLALRVSELQLDDDLVDGGLVAPTSFTDTVRTWDLGINWYSTAHTKAMLHVLYTDFDGRIVINGESLSAETTLLLQFQVHF